MSVTAPPPRQTIFISHGRPEEDDLTRWLCGRLSARGYRVWADLEQLLGGDPFWTDIQEAIRTQAARFLILVSRTSVTRTGVLNELAEATDVSRLINDERFIIPIKADDLPWSEYPIQLKRLNGLDFSSDWTRDFGTLLKTLEKANVPRDAGDAEVARTAEMLVQARQTIRCTPDVAILNRVNITDLPEQIHYLHTSLSSANAAQLATRITVPNAAHDRLLITFADIDTVRAAVPSEVFVEERHTLTLNEFTSGEPKRGPVVSRQQAHNYLAAILRMSIENFLRSAGLVQFDRRWFVPRDWRPSNQGHYLREGGKEHFRVLVGKAKELTWHFAISFKVFASEPRRIQLVPHVLFSNDGVTPLADQKQLRRRHCKLWWNDKWRDLLLAFTSELLGRGETASIALGGSSNMNVVPSLMRLTLPVTYSTESAFVPESEDEVDDWDGPEDHDQEMTTS